jgi:putative endonuclease
MKPFRHTLGAHGESLAAAHLQARGLMIIGRNWRCPAGELDIIARDGEEWVFVEVRTRRSHDTDTALESVTPAKQARLIATVQAYLEAHELDIEATLWRLDLVVIALGSHGMQIEVIHDIAGW